MGKDKPNPKTDIPIIYERMDNIGKEVSEIKDNHLVHLAADIKELREQVGILHDTIVRWGAIGATLFFILTYAPKVISLYQMLFPNGK